MRLQAVLLVVVGIFLLSPCCFYLWKGTIRPYVMPRDGGEDQEYEDLFDERDDL